MTMDRDFVKKILEFKPLKSFMRISSKIAKIKNSKVISKNNDLLENFRKEF